MLAISWTCFRDKESVLRLNNELKNFGIRHIMYVEENEVQYFDGLAVSRGRNNNATNGFGGDGTRGKLNMYKLALEHLQEGETLLDLDSDVSIKSLSLIKDLECVNNTMKGFYYEETPGIIGNYINFVDGKVFAYFTGCCKSYSYDLFKNICNSDKIEYYIDLLMKNNYTPSEDCFFSCISQIEFNCNIENLEEKYKHGKQSKNYNNNNFDIIS